MIRNNTLKPAPDFGIVYKQYLQELCTHRQDEGVTICAVLQREESMFTGPQGGKDFG